MFNHTIRQSLTLFFLTLLSFPTIAEDKAIIVFDASGSMWAKVEGKTKIEIAKNTLSNLVNDWDQSKQLGLLAYGHRKKGDCSDIETLVPVGTINKQSAINKVNKINPKGKTPISASLKMAASELKFTEDNATVILISDGKETCDLDPCKTATDLEKLGIDFTAHVIGFAVDNTTQKQLQCIAENTGGLYLPADNAKQLNDALKKVVEQPKVLTIRALDEKRGAYLPNTVSWTLTHTKTNETITLEGDPSGHNLAITKDSRPDSITAGKWKVLGKSDDFTGEMDFNVAIDKNQIVNVQMNKPKPQVTLNAPDKATAATALDITWEAPKDLKGLINLQPADEKPKFHASPLLYTQNKTEAVMRLPSIAGEYVLRFYDDRDRKQALVEHKITLNPAEIAINAPDEAGTGTEIDLSWVAPKTSDAKITMELADEKPKFHTNPHLYTREKKEGVLRMPATPGNYIFRYYNLSDRKVMQEKALTLLEDKVVINAPVEAGTGTEIDVSWEAPKTAEAKINLEPVGEKPKFHSKTHIYTKNKKESSMRLPSSAGEYVLRWYNLSDRAVVVEKPIALIEQQITISAPEEAGAGTEIDISWDAPKSAEAKINLEPVGEKPNFHSRFHIYTKNKKQAVMRIPSDSGNYLLRYYNLSDRKIIAEKPISITAQKISINTVDETTAGTEIELSWDAPKGLDSFINIQVADEKPNYNSSPYINTKKKQSDYMRMPSTEGEYTLRWWNRKDRKVLAEKNITLKPAKITIIAPETAIAGTEVEINWEAPKGLDSFINIQASDEKPKYSASHYVYTKKKTSEWMRLPSEAGEYKLRWWNKGARKNALTESSITLTKPNIIINAPETGIEGSEIEISWEAPKGLNSFINIQLADEKPNYSAKHYVYTSGKNSAYLKLPNQAGKYKIRWWNKALRKKAIHEQDFTIITGEE